MIRLPDRRAAALLVVAASAAGCIHPWHLPANAPGVIDVQKPPVEIAKPGLERPGDPGEVMLLWSNGVFAGGGFRSGASLGTRGVYGVGVESTILLGRSRSSHNADDFVLLPYESVGINFGWSFLEREGSSVGPGYLELQLTRTLVGAAFGYAWDPTDDVHGPQTTLFMGPLYMRVAYLLDRGFEMQWGMMLKLPFGWVWSR